MTPRAGSCPSLFSCTTLPAFLMPAWSRGMPRWPSSCPSLCRLHRRAACLRCEPGVEVLWAERSFRRCQSGQNGGKAVIWATFTIRQHGYDACAANMVSWPDWNLRKSCSSYKTSSPGVRVGAVRRPVWAACALRRKCAELEAEHYGCRPALLRWNVTVRKSPLSSQHLT